MKVENTVFFYFFYKAVYESRKHLLFFFLKCIPIYNFSCIRDFFSRNISTATILHFLYSSEVSSISIFVFLSLIFFRFCVTLADSISLSRQPPSPLYLSLRAFTMLPSEYLVSPPFNDLSRPKYPSFLPTRPIHVHAPPRTPSYTCH